MPSIKRSPFRIHCSKWDDGCGSDQCGAARNICLARGKLPCDVLFIGEAPGESEDVLGAPFTGPAGHLLDEMIAEAVDDKELRFAWTNIVGCIPRTEDGTEKASEPSKKQIKACAPRLREFVQLAKPKLVVFVGKLSEKHAPQAVEGLDVRTCAVQHPAFILRSGVADKGLLIQRCIATLSSEFEDLEGATP